MKRDNIETTGLDSFMANISPMLYGLSDQIFEYETETVVPCASQSQALAFLIADRAVKQKVAISEMLNIKRKTTML
ncbi:hypothetical protein PS862_01279 [Pseudomonas fluorescens]|uniref:Uncharacterized protein n=1 Tax=Pseudomonas fluorescens TaxID=294 RepID=A0A5E6RZZ4_PSEFL|nr:hypothetical protein [Pseudomonas fluorescens]VVM73402.1 hypothetical protein PS639_01893 [Pseudomonas fluorescens]VVO69819.1 hypothetical protein PS862_01279 [Pseudomonas fluorescens]